MKICDLTKIEEKKFGGFTIYDFTDKEFKTNLILRQKFETLSKYNHGIKFNCMYFQLIFNNNGIIFRKVSEKEIKENYIVIDQEIYDKITDEVSNIVESSYGIDIYDESDKNIYKTYELLSIILKKFNYTGFKSKDFDHVINESTKSTKVYTIQDLISEILTIESIRIKYLDFKKLPN